MVLSFTLVKVGDHYFLLYSLSSRSVGLFCARSVPEPSILTIILFNTVPGPYPYAEPLSSPKFRDPNGQVLYDSYSTTGNREQTFPATFRDYEPQEQYTPQPSFHPYSSSRPTTSHMTGSRDSRRLPPLSTSPGSQADRWQQPSYLPQSNEFSGANLIRSPTASYPGTYPTNQAYSLAHRMPQSHDHLASMNPQNHGPNNAFDDRRYSSSYGYSSRPSHAPYVPPPRTYSPPPVRPTSPEEPTIKKKRKRADATQLKVLDKTYSLTAFPSIEKRTALANMLDMSPRSVQIW
jgi:homeobox protein YOX1/YHP1